MDSAAGAASNNTFMISGTRRTPGCAGLDRRQLWRQTVTWSRATIVSRACLCGAQVTARAAQHLAPPRLGCGNPARASRPRWFWRWRAAMVRSRPSTALPRETKEIAAFAADNALFFPPPSQASRPRPTPSSRWACQRPVPSRRTSKITTRCRRPRATGFCTSRYGTLTRMTPVPASEPKADPMLMVRYRLEPSAELLENNQWRWSEGTVADVEGYDLLRPYHQLSVDMRPCADCAPVLALQARRITAKCRASRASEDPPRGHPHVIGIYNDRHWVHNRFNYKVVATCVPANAPPVSSTGRGSRRVTAPRHGICINATDGARQLRRVQDQRRVLVL